nr:type II toxin-antitoxin system RelE/ParE family toxin [Luteimonas sp. Y-2-2-4F]
MNAVALRWQQLLAHPHSGMARDDIGDGIRHLVVGRYLTLYRTTIDGIEIVRVLHDRRRIGRAVAP